MNKAQIRKVYTEKRKGLSDQDLDKMMDDIVDHFARLDLQRAATVLSYSPIESKKEVNVKLCEQMLVQQYPNIRIAHPRIIQNSNFMEAVVVTHDTAFSQNDYFIREPSHGEILTPESFDLVLVPMLAFDIRGFRVGYGKGFYDRWLAQCRPDVRKIGFSFFEPLERIDDINEFDVPLNLCITPMRAYEF